jgi:hypothetical protein
MVVVCTSQLAATTPLDVSRTITAIAWQADKVEEKASGGDEGKWDAGALQAEVLQIN